MYICVYVCIYVCKGCARTMKCAPSYANEFMDMFEERYIYPLIETMSKFHMFTYDS